MNAPVARLVRGGSAASTVRKNPGAHEPGYTPAPWSRRNFLNTFAGGLAVLWFLDTDTLAQETGGGRRGGRGGQARPRELAAWLHIAADGTLTVFTGKMECGQNARTSLTQVVAEELPVSLAAIKLVMGDTALVPHDAGTFGSQTTPQMAPQLRRAAATAREALLDLAAKNWSVDRATLTAADGKILHAASGRSVGFGELTQGEKLLIEIADRVVTKPAAEWKIAGTSVAKVNGRDFVTGAHRYASDIARPGMLHGCVLRPAVFEATLASLDTSAAEAMTGLKIVRDGNFVGVVAPTQHLAAQAVTGLRAEWKTTPQVSERELFAHLKSTARGGPPAAAASTDTFRQTYTVAYIAHTPLEPRAAVAEWTDGALTVWTGTQRPFGVRSELAQAFSLSEEKVRVIVPDTGSGYGGKHSGEAAIEAARLAKAAGAPVKLVWTREEEFTWAYFRPAGVIDIASSTGADGLITRWEHDNYNSGGAAVRAPYEFPGQRSEYHASRSPLKQGSYRGLAAAANHFARETHLDEVARTLRLDPLELRLRNLREPRARAVLEAVAARFGWGKTERTAGRGVGLAFGLDKGGWVATCAEVSVDRATGRVRVVRVAQAFECGAILNPDHLRSQNEGSIVQGLGGALFEAVRFDHGKILNPRFSGYRVPRFSDTPQIDIVLLDRKDLPSAGAGEAPIVGIAPAVGNAIFDATGVRLRSLPLVPNGLRV